MSTVLFPKACLHLCFSYQQGQFEVNYEPVWGLQGGDWPFFIRAAIKETAQARGLTANFMGRPRACSHPAESSYFNGSHFNCSIWDAAGARNLFYDAAQPDNVSDFARHWVAGLLKNMNAMTALLCPTVNCYRRMHRERTPSINSWGVDNRYTTLRVKNYGPSASYVENRVPSGLVNPYLALAANIAAGLDGVLNRLEPPAQGRNSPEAGLMLATLEEGLQALERSEVMREALGADFVAHYCCLKREGEIQELPLADMREEDNHDAFRDERDMYARFF
jgi:glutamine synthetase